MPGAGQSLSVALRELPEATELLQVLAELLLRAGRWRGTERTEGPTRTPARADRPRAKQIRTMRFVKWEKWGEGCHPSTKTRLPHTSPRRLAPGEYVITSAGGIAGSCAVTPCAVTRTAFTRYRKRVSLR